ncbi:MAG: hypothetical protein ACI4PF_06730 [Christensenellales bacterium]
MRLYYGGYGHNPSGKQYVYWGGDNYRTGQNVVAPVTNKFTGKTYNTMFTIMRTSGADSQMAQNEAQRLSQIGIGIKSIEGRDMRTLPGSIPYQDRKGNVNKSAWQKASKDSYLERVNTRIMSRGESFNSNTTSQQARLIGGTNV